MKTNVLLQKMNYRYASLRLMVMVIAALFISGSALAQTTVVDVIVNSPDHTTLETAVIAAGLDDDLSGPGPFTVFAPTDAAFEALPDGVLDDLLADPEGALAQVLLYHVVNANVASTDLTNGQFATTMHGDSIVVTISGTDVFINNAKVTTANIAADNGIVHVVDAVLVPGSTVYEVIAGSADHNTLEAGITTAGLQGTLSGPGPFTVFAPTDDAFAALPDGVLDVLLADPEGALTDVLLYHVIGASVASTDLTNGQFAATINGDSVVVTISGSDVYINNAMVSTADITTDNGIVHVIDAVLVPGSTVYEVIAGSADHNTLEAGITAAGLQGTLSGAGPFTVFAPTDAAFAALDEGVLEALLADPEGALTNVLLYHVVGAKAMSGELSDGQMITTLNGDSVMVSIVDGSVYINDAMVTVADIEADNGVVHVIDAVILPQAETTTVVDIIAGSPDHDTLAIALIAAGLLDDLSGEGPFTVFAPTDDAFAALPAGTLEVLLADPTGQLTQILLYHVVGAKALSTDLSDGQMITTLNGDSVMVAIMEGNVYINNAMVTVADIEADNGVVHVIDAVLVPTYTVVDIIAASPVHNTLEVAVIAAGLADDLSGEGPFTVFAPTDEAFAALPEGTLDALLEDPEGQLAQILLYHAVGSKALSTDLSDGQMITTLEGTDITVTITEGNVYINNAQVIFTDIEADNGVVHVIDAVLTPSTSIRERMIDEAGVTIYPNPAREYVNVGYEVLQPSSVKLEMYDMLGQQVRMLDQGFAYEGSYSVEFPVADLESGIYILIINTGKSQIANKVRVVK